MTAVVFNAVVFLPLLAAITIGGVAALLMTGSLFGELRHERAERRMVARVEARRRDTRRLSSPRSLP